MKWLKEDSYSLPIVLAVGLHVGIILTGLVAVSFSDPEAPKPKRPAIVNATVVDISDTVIGKREAKEKAANRQAIVAAEKRKKEAAQKRQKEADRKALEKKRKQVAEAKRIKEKSAEEAAKKENERKQAVEKKRLENEKKRLVQEAEKKRKEKQAEDARKTKEQELARQAEAEQRANEEKQRQAEASKLAEEKKQAEEAAAKAAAEKERQRALEEAQMVQSISSLINSRVTAVWSRPPSARNGMKTQLRINFLPNGEIRDAQVTKGSGDALFDQRAVDAVYKVGRIEELADVDSYTFERNFRQIDLIFNPQDLRN